jgi:hypothetical protein
MFSSMKTLGLKGFISLYLSKGFPLTIYAFTLLYIVFPNGPKTLMGVTNLPLNASPEEIRKAWGPGDAGSLLEVAISWSKLEQLDPVTQFWIVHLWAPGLAILEVPLIWISNIFKVPLFWSLTFLTVSAVIGVSLVFKSIVRSSLETFVIGIIAVALLLSWDLTYILRDGVFYTEGIGYSLLLSGLGIMSLNIVRTETRSIKLVVLSGVLIGTSIWIRHVSDNSLILLTSLASIIYLTLYIRHRKKLKSVTRSRKKLKVQNPTKSVKIILATSLIAIAVTIPWRIVSQIVFDGVPLVMSSASAGVGEGLWIDEKRDPDYYWIPYNMNWACNIDQIKCNSINNLSTPLPNNEKTIEAIKSAIKNPVGYFLERGDFLFQAWVPGFNSTASIIWKTTAVIPILMSFLIVFFLVRIRDRKKWYLLLVWLPFIVMLIGQLLIIHFESRYFIPLRLLIVGLFISMLNLFLLENSKYIFYFESIKNKFVDSLGKSKRQIESQQNEY